MAGFESKTVINRPIDEVFAIISDPTQGVNLVDNIIKCEKISDGPVGVGTRFMETRLMGGQEAQAELVIRAYNPPNQVTIGSDAEGVTANYHYKLAASGDGTEVHWECELQAVGLRRMMLPMLAGIMKIQDGDHLDKVKTALESQESPPGQQASSTR
ncbi:MAG: SRPBCC family protein [Anaerolineales bacterium]|nr:SRPBCC family protein [Anaerolineales bacterium]